MAILNLYKSRFPYCKFSLQDGSSVEFVNGRFATDNQQAIRELDAEIRNKHPYIFKDPAQPTINTDEVDQLELIKQRAVQDYIRSQAGFANSALITGGSVDGLSEVVAQSREGRTGLVSSVMGDPMSAFNDAAVNAITNVDTNTVSKVTIDTSSLNKLADAASKEPVVKTDATPAEDALTKLKAKAAANKASQ